MPSTGAVVYLKPTFNPTLSANRTTGLVFYIPLRETSGRFSASISSSATRNKKSWIPSRSVPYLEDDGKTVSAPWFEYLRFLGEQKLGGAIYPTLPDVTEYATAGQVSAIASNIVTVALAQMVKANAQTLQAVVSVATTAALPGAAQIPPVQVEIIGAGGE